MMPRVSEQAFHEVISGQAQGVVPELARLGLRGLSLAYAAAVRLRNAGYDLQVRRVHAVGLPVISIGNLTAGGTGKTPVVALVAQRLLALGEQPCLLSRGYRTPAGTDGNDEKLLLQRLCPGVPHLQNPDRVAIARQASEETSATVLILDDGFQHRRLARNVDIVLLDATSPFGHGYTLPRGLLREPPSGLARAHLVAITRCDQASQQTLSALDAEARRYGKPVCHIAFEPTELVDRSGNAVGPATAGVTDKVGAFCCIGNPAAFETGLQRLGYDLAFFEPFADHFHFDAASAGRLCRLAAEHGISRLICTEKDLVKLDQWPADGPDVQAVRIEARIRSGQPAFDAAILAALRVQAVA